MTWLSYRQAHAFEAEAARLRVSQVARASKGFMREYQKAGTPAAMRVRRLPSGVAGGTTWGQKRDAFVKRHMEQYRRNPTYRRFLALTMWAYRPPGPIPHHRSRRSSRHRSYNNA